MKKGRLKTVKNNVTKKYEIHGKDANSIWSLVNYEGKELIFDFEYDACAYLLMWIEWVSERKRVFVKKEEEKKGFSPPSFSEKNRRQRNVKNKMVKKSKKKNRNNKI